MRIQSHVAGKMASGSGTSTSAPTLIRKSNAKSPAWDYFGLRVDEKGKVVKCTADKPICKKCGREVPAKGGSTTNLFRHLEDHHPKLYDEVSPEIPRGPS